jgi:FkbM family methyltransferase
MAQLWRWKIDDRKISRAIRMPGRLIPKSAVFRIRSGPNRGFQWIAGSGTHSCWLGTYELAKQRQFERQVRPGMVIYDIGANAGFYTLLFSRLVGKTGTVYAFEPYAPAVTNLLEHLRLNHITNVKVIQAALGDENRMCSFSLGSANPGRLWLNAVVSDSLLKVPMIRIDDDLFPHPDLIKMDVEGNESMVLAGACNTLRSKRPIVFVAMHGTEQPEICPRLLRDAGYALFGVDDKPVLEKPHTDEVFALPTTKMYI